MTNGNDAKWHVSRGIPVAFIVSMLFYAIAQTATAAWFASAMSQRMDTVEKVQLQISPQGERLTRVEEKLESVKSGIGDIKVILAAQDARDRAKPR
jgi:hypothetical protein